MILRWMRDRVVVSKVKYVKCANQKSIDLCFSHPFCAHRLAPLDRTAITRAKWPLCFIGAEVRDNSVD
jgi:hypothetical protein